MKSFYLFNDEDWAILEPLISELTRGITKSEKLSDRIFLEATLYIERTINPNVPFHLPLCYGDPSEINNRIGLWDGAKVWDNLTLKLHEKEYNSIRKIFENNAKLSHVNKLSNDCDDVEKDKFSVCTVH